MTVVLPHVPSSVILKVQGPQGTPGDPWVPKILSDDLWGQNHFPNDTKLLFTFITLILLLMYIEIF